MLFKQLICIDITIWSTFWNREEKNKSVYHIDILVQGVIASQNGTLSFLVGGSKTGFEQTKPILQCMGQNIFHCGGTATGQVYR